MGTGPSNNNPLTFQNTSQETDLELILRPDEHLPSIVSSSVFPSTQSFVKPRFSAPSWNPPTGTPT